MATLEPNAEPATLTTPPAPSTSTEPPAIDAPTPPAAPTVDEIKAMPEFKTALTEEVERVFSNRLGRETERIKRDLQREQEASPSTTPPAEPAAPVPTTDRSEENLRLDFYMAVIDTPMDKPARDYLEKGWLQTKGHAGTAADYISDALRAFGGGKPQPEAQPSTAAPPAQPAPTPPGTPVSDKGGPSTTNDQLAESSMERWGPDHIARFRAEAIEAKTSPAQYVKSKMLESLRGKTLVFPR